MDKPCREIGYLECTDRVVAFHTNNGTKVELDDIHSVFHCKCVDTLFYMNKGYSCLL